MRIAAKAILFFLIPFGAAQLGLFTVFPTVVQEDGIHQKPEFFVLDWKEGTALTEESTSIAIEADSLASHDVNVLLDNKGLPVLYAADISTPVCADGECRLMHIRLYWTLLGDYAGFDRYPDLPLTKHDHDEFLKADYTKLHELLKDDLSILARRKIDELVKKPEQPQIPGVDALSGATIAEVKESVVSGALYSCYVAWHLAHGEAKQKIRERTLPLIDDTILLDMLNSSNTDYQMFALNQLNAEQYEEHYIRVAEIFRTGIPMVRTFIIKNLPDNFWESKTLQGPFWNSFAETDINSRSLLLEHIKKAPESILEYLSSQLDTMTKNQLRIFLEFLGERQEISIPLKSNLETFANSNSQTYAYLVAEFLSELE